MIADEDATRSKFAAARERGVPTVTGGTPFEIAVHQGLLPQYMDLCAALGATRIEVARGFTEPDLSPKEIVRMAADRGLGLDLELGASTAAPSAGGRRRAGRRGQALARRRRALHW